MLQANLVRAYGQYSEELLEGCSKQSEFRVIVFALCYFHAALLERKKFGVGNLPGSSSGAALLYSGWQQLPGAAHEHAGWPHLVSCRLPSEQVMTDHALLQGSGGT